MSSTMAYPGLPGLRDAYKTQKQSFSEHFQLSIEAEGECSEAELGTVLASQVSTQGVVQSLY
jgi:hypothetical protein